MTLANGDIVLVDPSNCSSTFIGNTGTVMNDIAVCPNGNMYGTDGYNFYQINITNASLTYIGSMSTSMDYYNALVCDQNNTIYTAAYNSTGIYTVNPTTGQTISLGSTGFSSAGDLTFYNGSLYFAALNNELVQININTPSNSTSIGTMQTNSSVFGVVTVDTGNCNNQSPVMLATGGHDIYYTNPSNGTISIACPNLVSFDIYGATSTSENTNTVFTVSTSSNPSQCSTANGSATATVAGASGTYTYLWSPGGQTTATATNLAPGQYCVTVNNTTTGCNDTSCVTVGNTGNVIATANSTSVSCNGLCDGTATASATGGTGIYTYSWNSAPVQTTAIASGLCIGIYSVTIGNSGCTSTASVTITQPSAIVLQTSSTTANCNQASGSASVIATGGTPGYTYLWSSGGQTTTTATNLVSGQYCVTVTDATGCSNNSCVTVGNTGNVIASANSTSVTCNGLCDGIATASVTGGTGPYTYFWNTTPLQATSTVTGLCAAGFTVTVTDNNGCISMASVNITEPSAIVLQTNATTANCNQSNGSASVIATGGTPGYSYLWSSGGQTTTTATNLASGQYCVTVTDASGCSNSSCVTVGNTGSIIATATSASVSCNGLCDGTATASVTGGTGPYTYSWNTTPVQATSIATGLCAVGFTVTVTDNNGCTNTASVNITEPSIINPQTISTSVSCNGLCDGTATTSATGGTGSYTYSWNTAPIQTTSMATGLCAAGFTVTVTDNNGCTNTASVVITQPTALLLQANSITAHCNQADGSATVIANGGMPGYIYLWTPGGQTNATANNLSSGQYCVNVIDINGCSDTSCIFVNNTPPIMASTSSTLTSCFSTCDGTATASASGGAGTYTYSWNSIPVQTTAIATGLCAGNYTVTISDPNNCVITTTALISEPAQIVATPSPSVTICQGQSTLLSATATGGSGTYTYIWNPGNVTTSSLLVNPSNTTIYTVSIKDGNNCVALPATITVNVNPPLAVVAVTSDSICLGDSKQIVAIASGGNGGPYSYSWSPATQINNPNIFNPIVNPTTTTTYVVTVTDNCTVPNAKDSVKITVFPLPVVNFASDVVSGCEPLCVNFTDLSTVINGTIIGWDWNFDGNGTSVLPNPSHCFNTPGVYNISLTTTSNYGCVSTLTNNSMITVFANPVAEFNPSPNPVTVLDPTVTLHDLSSSDVNYWNWTFGDGNSLISNNPGSPEHIYPNEIFSSYTAQLIVHNSNNCYDTVSHVIIVGPDYTFFIPNAFTPNGDGENDFFFGKGIGIINYDIWIFDRWGNMIFHGDHLDDYWDGKANHGAEIAQQDVYVWKVKLTDVFGKKHNFLGSVTLVK